MSIMPFIAIFGVLYKLTSQNIAFITTNCYGAANFVLKDTVYFVPA
jgi:uncharacterized protein (DUF1919 family)